MRKLVHPELVRDPPPLPGPPTRVLFHEERDPEPAAPANEFGEPRQIEPAMDGAGLAADDVPADARRRGQWSEGRLVADPSRAFAGEIEQRPRAPQVVLVLHRRPRPHVR